MSEIKVNKISQRSGTAITLGNSGTDFQLPSGADIVAQSGSTITIAAGATITNSGTATGFGATYNGAVNWDTTPKTSSPVTAVSGNGYFINTTSGAITINLPSTPSVGDIVAVSDYANISGTNNITVGRNGSNIEGSATNLIISNNGISMTFVYVDVTKGWKVTGAGQSAQKNPSIPEYVAATGGTITCCGNYKIHTFTGPGTFTVTSAGNSAGSSTVDYLVVAGGGGAGGNQYVGGGGAGGFRESVPSPAAWTASPLASPGGALPVSATGYPITVGSGGPGGAGSPSTDGTQGNPSIFSTITSAGGGFSVDYSATTPAAASGGSGAGGTANVQNGGAGNTPPVSPSQGNSGGNSSGAGGGGGGGAGGVGSNSPGAEAVNPGGPGVATSISTSPVTYAAGGRGGSGNGVPSPADGTVNTGNGASRSTTPTGNGGSGGSGIVIIRYKYQ
jgi:hypothetical protein